MDFNNIDIALRVVIFTGILGSAASIAVWYLATRRTERIELVQVAIAASAMATIPAAVAAPSSAAALLDLLGVVAILGLAAALCLVLAAVASEGNGGKLTLAASQGGPALATAVQHGFAQLPVPAYAGAILAAASLPAATRVGSPAAATNVASVRPSVPDATMLHGRSHRPVDRIAFLVENTGDGFPRRLGDDTGIGRGQGATILIDDHEVSRDHARIKYEKGRFVLYDLGGANGTYLVREGRRRRIHTPTLLNDRDLLCVGACRLAFFEVDNLSN